MTLNCKEFPKKIQELLQPEILVYEDTVSTGFRLLAEVSTHDRTCRAIPEEDLHRYPDLKPYECGYDNFLFKLKPNTLQEHRVVKMMIEKLNLFNTEDKRLKSIIKKILDALHECLKRKNHILKITPEKLNIRTKIISLEEDAKIYNSLNKEMLNVYKW